MYRAALILVALAQLPVSPDAAPVRVTGVVLDIKDLGTGRPLANTDIWLSEGVAPDLGRRAGMELWWTNLTRPIEGASVVLVHTQSDSSGSFALDVPPDVVARRSPTPLAIWAVASGPERRLTVRRLPPILLADDAPVRLQIGSVDRAEITVLGPDRKPVAGAKVTPTHASEIPIPEPLGRSLAAITDTAGRAVLAGLSPADLDEVHVEAIGFGKQIIQIQRSAKPDSNVQEPPNLGATLSLAPAGRLKGRLVVPGDETLRGVTIHATTKVGGYDGSGKAGLAEVSCDPHGRFEIAALAEGALKLALDFDRQEGSPWRGEASTRAVISPGNTTEITVPLRQTLKVQGLIREKGTKRPIAGVKVALNGQFGGDHFAVTDAAGNFQGRIVRELNQPFGWSIRIPTPFYYPTDEAEAPQGMPRRGTDELVLPPTDLPRGVDVHGTVAGENNTGVAGALVEAVWTSADGMAQAALARSDHSGSFAFHGVDPLAELKMFAWDAFASTAGVITTRVADARAKPVALTLSPRSSAPLGGRVIDSAGRGLAGASVRIWRDVQNKEGRAIVIDPIANEDGTFLHQTDSEGRYRTSRRVPLRGIYYAEATVPEHLSARSTQITLSGQARDLPDLSLRRVAAIDGRVVDSQGKPVSGALVRQSGDGPLPTRTLSDELGRFRLPGVLAGPIIVFAEKEGFRFGFQPAGDALKPVVVVLGRTGEPPAVSYRTLPPPLPVDEEKAMARQLIERLAQRVFKNGKDEDKFAFLRDTAAIDPFAALERLSTVKFSEPDYADFLRVTVLGAVARQSLDEATALLESTPDARARAIGYVGICESVRDLAPDRARELIAQAAVNARNMKTGGERTRCYARIADHWVDLGEKERARVLLDEALELGKNEAKANSGRSFTLAAVAETLARLDLPAGLKLLDDLARDVRKNDSRDRTYVFDRFLGRIAYKLAAQSPADAEMVLKRMPPDRSTDRAVIPVCTKMAPKDLARARRIADTRVSPDLQSYRPYALGLMAQAIAAKDKPASIRLLNDAYADLAQLAATGQRDAHSDLSKVGAGLLPVVEELEPERLGEFLGRTLALRPPRGDQTELTEAGIGETTAALAMVVARYDRKLAALLLDRELQKTGTYQGLFGSDFVTWRVLAAQALIDPKNAVELVQAIPDDPGTGTGPQDPKNQATIQIAKLLASHGADRWEHVLENFLYLWTPAQRFE
jgi:protocatechuate 3,4-dioxygenase beta subunit